jgi:hypothetical protein
MLLMDYIKYSYYIIFIQDIINTEISNNNIIPNIK